MEAKRFKNKETFKLFMGEFVKGIPTSLVVEASNQITAVLSAHKLEDLKIPPSNQLEKLKYARKGQWAIRVNKQYRICSVWQNGQAEKIEFVDYHDEKR